MIEKEVRNGIWMDVRSSLQLRSPLNMIDQPSLLPFVEVHQLFSQPGHNMVRGKSNHVSIVFFFGNDTTPIPWRKFPCQSISLDLAIRKLSNVHSKMRLLHKAPIGPDAKRSSD
jgi:hypothetical protein